MQLTNKKLAQRGIDMIVLLGNVTPEKGEELLMKYGSVKAAMENINA
jgi:N-acetylmuramic acid 6-phosphate (MurNAc-6-P) etherase